MKANAPVETCAGIGRERLAIEVTTCCNGECLHCFAHAGISKRSSLSPELVKEIIADGYDVGYRHLHITGGEPLLWKGLFEALDYAFAQGYETIFMNTNGTLISEAIGRRLSAYSRFSISVSLDGPPALHDDMRGLGSHRKTVRGIEKALDAGIDITIFTTATKSLLPQLPRFVDDLYRRFSGIEYLIIIQLIAMPGSTSALSDELLEPDDFIRLVETVAFLNVYGLRSIVKKNPLANVVSHLRKMPWIPRVPPLYREGSLIVMANRNMGIVHSNRDSFARYRPGMIRKVLASDAYRKAVMQDETVCPSCKYVELCRENDMIRPSEGCRDMQAEDLYCRRVLDMVSS